MSDDEPLSRRGLLKSTVAAAASSALLAQTGAFGQAPAAKTRKRFKAWISRGDGPGRTTLQEVDAAADQRAAGGRAHRGHQSLLLERAAGARPSAAPAAAAAGVGARGGDGARRMNDMALIQGHGGVGIVEAVGPEVRRVQVGDRVCVSGTPHAAPAITACAAARTCASS